jgi:integrase
MRTHVGAKRKARTLDSYETLLRRHILPAIGGFRVTDIRRAHVSKMHADLAAHAGAANRALSVVSAIWNWAAIEHEDLALPPNPAKGIKRNPEEGRERFLSSDELARLGDALEEAGPPGRQAATHRRFLCALIWCIAMDKAGLPRHPPHAL